VIPSFQSRSKGAGSDRSVQRLTWIDVEWQQHHRSIIPFPSLTGWRDAEWDRATSRMFGPGMECNVRAIQ
jgi:hypothetical protein